MTALTPEQAPELDFYELDRAMDRTKTHVFLGSNAAFFGPLMAAMTFIWTVKCQTAQTNGITLEWNPYWFMSLPEETRKTVLVHELEHVAKMHMLRADNRTAKRWNHACDININNGLERQGYSFVGVEDCWKDQQFKDMAPEDIYELLPPEPQCAPWGPGPGGEAGDEMDMLPADSGQQTKLINAVLQASQAATLIGGSAPGETSLYLKKFLTPIIPWERELQQWFTDLGGEDYSLARPNRRYQDIYMSSLLPDNERLEHLAYYLDVSGSISDEDILRFNSEVKYVKDTFNPEKLTLIQFDDGIRQVDEITENDQFDEIKVIGRGGTMWGPVQSHIEEIKPTCAVIFTDLGFCDPVRSLNINIPILWVVNHNLQKGPFGRTIQI